MPEGQTNFYYKARLSSAVYPNYKDNKNYLSDRPFIYSKKPPLSFQLIHITFKKESE